MCTQEHKPIPKPRQMKRPSEVSCSGQDGYKPPMQETCRPAQTLTSYLNRADMAHLRQQSTPLVAIDQRGIVFPKTRRYVKPLATESNSSSHSQTTPFSPSLEKDSAHPKPFTKPGNVETSLSLALYCVKNIIDCITVHCSCTTTDKKAINYEHTYSCRKTPTSKGHNGDFT